MSTLEPLVAPSAPVRVRVPQPSRDRSAAVLRWAGTALVATVWGSASLFGLYILAFYAGALADGSMATWNRNLAGLYVPGSRTATAGIGLHFAAGGVILALGCIQLMGGVRRRWPAVHRWIGRVYVAAAFLAGLGGLTFIATNRTIGRTPMDVGFGLYGVLMLVASVQAYRHARARRLDTHRAWALRLFALAIGSWLYRMDYGFWLLLAKGVGHTQTFTGPFDHVMDFFFYIPNLLVAEAFIRARRTNASPVLRLTAAGALVAATGFLLLGTYYFTKLYWGPAILHRLGI